MDVETAIQSFASAGHDPPRDAMQWALDHWDEVAPGLPNLLERFASGADRSNDAASTVFFILYLAGYCGTTALLWKQFWKPFMRGESQARALFWNFLKNFSLADGFLLVTFGTSADAVRALLANPIVSSHPYRIEATAR